MFGTKLLWVVYLAQVLATCQVCFAIGSENNCTDSEDNVTPCFVPAPYDCVYETGSMKKVVNEGSNEILECAINYPGGQFVEHIIQWKREGQEQLIFAQFEGFPAHVDAQYTGRIHLVEQASIEITNIRQSDAGWYICKVIFLDASEEKEENVTKVYLQVNSPPRITNSSNHLLTPKRGQSAFLFCEASGMPTPVVSWTKNGEPLSNRIGKVTVDGNKIEIVDLQHKDGGIYVCTFQNSISHVSQSIKLVVEGSAYIMNTPRNTTVREFQKVKLTCQAEGYPDNITYRWYKDDVDVKLYSNQRGNIQIQLDGTLVINSVHRTDSGWYRCRPTNGIGTAPEAKAYLNVKYLPEVLPVETNLYFPKGMSDLIPCPIRANPPVNNVVWTKDGERVQYTERVGVGQDWSLLFKNIRSEDDGTYKCIPYNELGRGQESALMQVTVRDPPYFTIRPLPYYQRMLGESVTFPCAASGTPLPRITWRTPNTYVPDKNRQTMNLNNLTISRLKKSDHGKYECVAENVVTSVVTSTQLFIEMTTPHAPYNITVTTTQFSATIDWKPAYDGGYEQHYIIWFKRTSDQGWQTIRVIPNKATSFTIHKLVPNTDYDFMVLSGNQLGNGLYSETKSQRTKGYDSSEPFTLPTDSMGQTYFPPIVSPQGPRPGIPYNVTAVLFDNGNIQVSWTAPQASSVPIYYYVLRYRKLGQNHWEKISGKIMDPKTSYTLRGLLEGDTYQFSVIAYSLYAYSYPSDIAEIQIYKASTGSVPFAGGIISIIVGSFLVLIIIIVLIVVMCRVWKKKRKRRKEEKYGDIKYDTPNHVNSFNKNQEKNAGKDTDGFSGFGGMKAEVYAVSGQHGTTDPYKDNVLAAEKWNKPRDINIFDRNFIGYEPDKVRKVHREHGGGSYPVDIDYYHHPSEIHRTADGRFLLWGDGDNYVNMDHHDVNDIINEPHVYFTPGAGPLGSYNDHPSARLRTTESGEHLSRRDSYEDAIRRYSPRPEEYDTGQYSPRRRESEYRGQFVPRFHGQQQHERQSPRAFEFDPRRMSQQFRDYVSNPPSHYIPGSRPGSYLPTPPGDRYYRQESPVTHTDGGYQRRFVPRSQETNIPRRYQPRSQRDSYDDPQAPSQHWDGYGGRTSHPRQDSYDDERYPHYRSRSSPPLGRYPENYDHYEPPRTEERPRSHSMPPHSYFNRGYEYDDYRPPLQREEPYFSPQSRTRPEPQVPLREQSRDSSPYDRYGESKSAYERPGWEPPPPRVPPFQRGSHATEDSMQGSFQTPSIGSEHDDAMHPRSMVRHSTAKPLRPDRTFHTSSPSEEVGLQPFDLDELSSVNPSSTATSRRTFPSASTFPTSSSNFPSSSNSNVHNSGLPQARQSETALSPVIDMSSIPQESSDMYDYDLRQPQRRFSAGDIRPEEEVHRLSRDSSPSRERQIARVSPSPKREGNPPYSRGEGSEERPFHYTRDRLQGAIERARRGPIARRLQGSSKGGAPDLDQPSETPHHAWNALTPSTGEKTRDDSCRDGETTVIPQMFADSVAPYKDIPANRTSVTSGLSGSSGRGSSGGAASKTASLSQSHPNIAQMDQSGDMPSSSSGQGSRNTSQTMSSSSQSARGRMNSSLSSTNTPQEHDISTESSPYSIGDLQHKRDASVDENYEFDNPTESELLDALRNVSKTSRSGSRDFNVSDPDIMRHDRGGRSDRFSKLREEYKQYRRKQQQQQPESPGGEQWEEIESELL